MPRYLSLAIAVLLAVVPVGPVLATPTLDRPPSVAVEQPTWQRSGDLVLSIGVATLIDAFGSSNGVRGEFGYLLPSDFTVGLLGTLWRAHDAPDILAVPGQKPVLLEWPLNQAALYVGFVPLHGKLSLLDVVGARIRIDARVGGGSGQWATRAAPDEQEAVVWRPMGRFGLGVRARLSAGLSVRLALDQEVVRRAERELAWPLSLGATLSYTTGQADRYLPPVTHVAGIEYTRLGRPRLGVFGGVGLLDRTEQSFPVGGRIGWHLLEVLALELEGAWHPSRGPGSTAAADRLQEAGRATDHSC